MRELIAERISGYRDRLGARRRFLANIVGEPSPELRALISQPGREAAVLVPIVERSSGLTLLLTERSRHLAHHPGQVAFPGGRVEPDDVDTVATALREAFEEIALASSQVDVIGSIGPHITGTGFMVTPHVAFVDGQFCARPDPHEVSAVFEVPLDYLLDPANCEQGQRERLGTRFVTPEFRYEGWRIWGATAAMIVSLTSILLDSESYE